MAGRPVYVRVTVAWRMPLYAQVPGDVRPHWPAKWSGAGWSEGRLLSIPAEIYRWLRRTQGDYMERCFTVTEGFGRTYLRAGPCPPLDPGEARAPEAAPLGRRVEPAAPAGVTVRRCGCGRR